MDFNERVSYGSHVPREYFKSFMPSLLLLEKKTIYIIMSDGNERHMKELLR